ncbi:hypothetical protein BS78_06G262100 [Paspalum vaginatum]|nr:hypothetical protein BS78_06G262100 [Paspalum vaginatum]
MGADMAAGLVPRPLFPRFSSFFFLLFPELSSEGGRTAPAPGIPRRACRPVRAAHFHGSGVLRRRRGATLGARGEAEARREGAKADGVEAKRQRGSRRPHRASGLVAVQTRHPRLLFEWTSNLISLLWGGGIRRRGRGQVRAESVWEVRFLGADFWRVGEI